MSIPQHEYSSTIRARGGIPHPQSDRFTLAGLVLASERAGSSIARVKYLAAARRLERVRAESHGIPSALEVIS